MQFPAPVEFLEALWEEFGLKDARSRLRSLDERIFRVVRFADFLTLFAGKMGRHRIARLDFEGQALNAILPEGLALPAGDLRAQFDPGAVSVYVDDWRVAPTDVPEMAQ